MKQAANNLYKELANFLLRQGFTRSRKDHCLFTRSTAEDHTFVLVGLDDIIVASRSMTVISDNKKALKATFCMEDRARLHWFLGPRIRQDDGKVTVDPERYIETTLERFQMGQCKHSRTPADLNLKLQTAQIGDEEVDQRIYRSLVGSFLYHVHSQHSVQAQERTFQSTLALRKTTSAISSRFKRFKNYTKEASYDLVGESDADWSGDVNDRISITGYYFKLNGRGAALSWGVKSRPQLLFLHQKQNIRAWQQQFRKHST